MRIMPSAVFLCALIGLIHTGWDFAAHRALSALTRSAGVLLDQTPQLRTTTAGQDAAAFHREAVRLDAFAAASPQLSYLRGRSALLHALSTRNSAERLALLCESLKSYRSAAATAPHRSAYHIAWADLEAHLPAYRALCGRDRSPDGAAQLSPNRRLAWARELAPYSTTNLYLAAVVYLGLGQKPEALSLLRLNQEINPSFTPQQRQYAYDLVTTEEELSTALPRRYPEIVYWIQHFSAERESDYRAWNNSFVAALNDALNELQRRLQENAIAPETYARFLKGIDALPLAARSQQLRRRLDELLLSVYEIEGNGVWSGVLKERTALERLGVLKAVINDDKDARATMLFGWLADAEGRHASLDVQGRSLGIYVPRGNRIELLILQNAAISKGLTENTLELLYSADNQSFHALTPAEPITTVLVDGKETVIVRLPQTTLRYLKLHYRGTNRDPRFTNRIADLVQAYGVTL